MTSEHNPDGALPRVAVVGMHGYGAVHVRQAIELAAQSKIDFVAAADRAPADLGQLPKGVREFVDLADLLADVEVDIVTIATPIPTHLPIAEMALRAGADVMLEKPPVTSLEQFERLQTLADQVGKVIQVGFQSFGSAAIPVLQQMMESSELGDITGISGIGRWLRNLDYWQRSAWAGRRELDGVQVIDGVVTNPLAHATATALRIARADTLEAVGQITVDLFHANDIQADDTSVVRIVTSNGLPITVALTLCAQAQEEPFLDINGSAGRARFFYTNDVVEIYRPQSEKDVRTYSRASLLDNLVQHRVSGVPLISPLKRSGAFTQVMDAVRSTEPRLIASEFTEVRDDDQGMHVVVTDIEHWIERASAEHKTFTELGAPFA